MKFTPTHEWILLDENVATVGITDYAQKELGEIVYVELPRIGHRVSAGDEVAVLESTKAAVDIYSPLSGEIIEVNQELKEKPHLINHSPQLQGWIYKLRLLNSKELTQFMNAEEYVAYLNDD